MILSEIIAGHLSVKESHNLSEKVTFNVYTDLINHSCKKITLENSLSVTLNLV